MLFNCLLKLLSVIELVPTNNIQLPPFNLLKCFTFLFFCSLVWYIYHIQHQVHLNLTRVRFMFSSNILRSFDLQMERIL